MPLTPEENKQLFDDIQTSFNREPNAKKFSHENWVNAPSFQIVTNLILFKLPNSFTYLNWAMWIWEIRNIVKAYFIKQNLILNLKKIWIHHFSVFKPF